ncbi:hypothetical protein EUX98_g1553 [Antrodiella citrinella]|uniref:Uncharacterized protein n=1 Tax=Antrodiella citrinella TaxID=2447956 RepID=A0A4S4N2M6_9APHY|nr:hypothetical protein EUX98_g1553 [Antrodiella citrinella]
MPIGVFPPKAPEQPTAPTSQSTLELAKTLKCNGIITVAPFVEEWAHDDEAIQAIAKFSLVSYAGATSLSSFATDTFASAGAHLIPSNDCCVSYHAGVMFYNWNSTENDDDESLDLPEVDNPLIFALQKHSILGGKRLGT